MITTFEKFQYLNYSIQGMKNMTLFPENSKIPVTTNVLIKIAIG